jgi:trk system potassium uptake protein TrkH
LASPPFSIFHDVYPSFDAALRDAAFNVVSIATTTGFATTDYALWPFFAPLWMLFLCSFATSAGSTGGGIKMIRAHRTLQAGVSRADPRHAPQRRASGKSRQRRRAIQHSLRCARFRLCVHGLHRQMTLLLSLSGLEIITAFSAVVASINNTGPGLGQVGPASNYAGLSDFQIWVCTFAMLLGRLEIFTLLVVMTPAFWRK